ncbi:MAG: transporter substrate-binding domain-containing protein, partial [Chromatiaceae bacterium]
MSFFRAGRMPASPPGRRPVLPVVVGCLLFLVLLLASLQAVAEPLERVTLQLKWFHQFQFAGYYAAVEQGFYADEGLEVELRERDPRYDPLDDVLAGRADYGVTDSGLILAALRDDPVVLVAQIFQHSPLVLLTRQAGDLRTPHDLAGKTVTMDSTGLTHVPLLAMLSDASGVVDSLEIKPSRFNPGELIEGATDAFAAYRTNEPFYFDSKDVPVRIIDPRDYGIDFYGDNLFTTEHELTENPGRVARMRRATLRGWAYALEHPNEIIDLILTRYNTQQRSRQHLQFEARETARVILPQFVQLGSINQSRLDKIAQTYARLGLATQVDLRDDFTYQPLKDQLSDAERQHLTRRPVLRVGATDGQVPLTFLTDGAPQGYLNDLFRDVAGLLDLEIQWVPVEGYLAGIMALAAGDVDLLTNFSAGTLLQPAPLETDNVLTVPFVAVGRTGAPAVRRMEDLLDKRLILVAGYQQTRAIQQRYPEIATSLVGSISHAYRLLRNGEGDYYIDNATHAGYFLNQFMISDLQTRGELPVEEVGQLQLRYAITPTRPLLLEAVNKALKAIEERSLLALKAKWLETTTAETIAAVRPLDLSMEEREWLSRNPRIAIGINERWPPFGFVDSGGELVGVGVDLVAALNKRLDGALELHPGDWYTLYRSLAASRLSGLLDLTPLPEREALFNFTEPYTEIPHVFVVRKDSKPVLREADLHGRTLALERGFGNVGYFEQQHPQVRIRTYPDTISALEAVSRGEVDAYAGNRAVVNYLVRQNLFIDLEVQGRLQNLGSVLAIGTPKDQGILRNILQKALDSLTLAERQAIFDKWTMLPPDATDSIIEFTEAEQTWLAANPSVRVALDPGWAPMEYRDEDGRYRGISADYLARLEELLGIRFEPVAGLSWQQAIDAIKKGTADMFASVARTSQREAFAVFTRPYIEVPIRVFARRNVTYIGSLENLAGKRVAVPRGYAVHDWLSKDYPDIRLVEVKDPAEGLEHVAAGKVAAF